MIRLVAAIWLMLVGGACAGEAIIDGETGRLVAGVDAHKPRFPASTTKLMTIFVALEAAEQGEVDLEARVHVSKHAASAPPVKLGLKAGEDIRLGDAIHAALIISSNDAARVIAEAVSGTEHAFAARMTATIAAVRDAIERFECVEGQFHPAAIRAHAETFSRTAFRNRFTAAVDDLMAAPPQEAWR